MALAGLACCEGPDPGREARPALRRDTFAASIQPLLSERCANPSCHGDAARPFSLYAARKHRADPRLVFSEEPLTAAEQEHNFAAASLMTAGAPSPGEALLLRKALAGQASTYHGGGAVLEAQGPAHAALLAWLAGEEAP